jgi:ribosomal protein S10
LQGRKNSSERSGRTMSRWGGRGGGRAAAVALVTLYLALLGLWSVQTLQKQERKGLTMRSPPQAHEQRRTKELWTTIRSPHASKQERRGFSMRSPPQAHEQRRTKELWTTIRSPHASKQERRGFSMRSPPQAHEQRRPKEVSGTTIRSPHARGVSMRSPCQERRGLSMRSPPLANEKKDRHRATKPGANELLPIFLGGFWCGQSQKKQHSDTKNLRFTQEKMVHAQIFAPVHIPSKYYQQLPAPSADRLIKDASQFLELIKTNCRPIV